MEEVRVKCDRCKRIIDGIEDDYCTGGFYRITPGTYWARFADQGEEVICQDCMLQDERFIAVYGKKGPR
jgi:hypothetical protein